MVGLVRHYQRKRRATDRLDLRTPAPVFDSTRPRPDLSSGACGPGGIVEEFNLHTIVRLPNGVFAPYTSIPTIPLFKCQACELPKLQIKRVQLVEASISQRHDSVVWGWSAQNRQSSERQGTRCPN